GDVAGPQDVGVQALERIELDHRHVLQRGRMEHQVRLRLAEQAVDPLPVPHVPDHGAARQRRNALPQFQVDAVEVVLGAVEQRQLGRLERGDLARQLGTDGPAGAGHQYPAPFDELLHGLPVERCLRPSEQVLDGDGADLQLLLDAAAEIGEARQARHRGAVAVGQLQHVVQLVTLQRLGEDDALRLALAACETAEHLGQVVELPEYRHAVTVAADAGALLVDGAQHLEGAVRSEEHTSELQSRENLVCRLLLEKKKNKHNQLTNYTS